jgi:hypothetical protein
MKQTRDAAAPDALDAKPADLPDLPLRSRFALLVLALVLAALVFLLFLIAFGASAGRWPLGLLFLLLAMIWFAVLLWKGLRRAWVRDAGQWWRASLSEDDRGLRLDWQAQRWRDLSPWRNPTAWSEPLRLPMAVLPAISVLILIQGAAHADPEAITSAARWAIGCLVASLSVLAVIPSLFVPFQQKAKSVAFLSSETVTYVPPNLSYHPPPGRMVNYALVLGGTSYMRILTRGVRFAPDGVAILGPRRFGIIPNHFIIPTRDPEIRERIRAWADEQRIPVSGEV